jgi:hypothetical protein
MIRKDMNLYALIQNENKKFKKSQEKCFIIFV